jgi:hypothetical protein
MREPSAHPPTAPGDPSPSVPKTDKRIPTRQEIISNIRKMLLARPDFSGLYAAVLVSEGLNPSLANTLAEAYQKKFGAPMSPTNTCTHIKVNGVRCGSPSLRGERFCYFHQRMTRGVRTPPQSRLHPIALIEDPQAIQVSLMEVINALMRDTIDIRRATLILRALHIAVKNARNVRIESPIKDPVQEIPEYAEPEAESAVPARTELDLPLISQAPFIEPDHERRPAVRAQQLMERRVSLQIRSDREAEARFAARRAADEAARAKTNGHAKTATAAPPSPTANKTDAANNGHTSNHAHPAVASAVPTRPAAVPAPQASASAPQPTQRKPPASVRVAQMPAARKKLARA